MKMERTKFFERMYVKVKKLDSTNILDGFNYNTNLDIPFQNVNKKYTISIYYIVQFHTFAQVDTG